MSVNDNKLLVELYTQSKPSFYDSDQSKQTGAVIRHRQKCWIVQSLMPRHRARWLKFVFLKAVCCNRMP